MTIPDDILATVKTALELDRAWCASWAGKHWPDTAPPAGAFTTHSVDTIRGWLRALVARCEQAEADLAALRQRHAEAVEAFRNYADHEDGCAHVFDFEQPCTCGFGEAKARLT